jgi:PilZ domain
MQRRQHPRVRLRLPVRLRWVAPLGQKIEQCETRNASRGGLLLACRDRHEIGMPIWVTFPYDSSIPDAQPEVLGRVVRCEEGRAKDSPFTTVAVHFESSLRTSLSGNGSRKLVANPPAEWRRLGIPVRVRLQHIPWFEEAMTIEVSRDGLRFVSNREYAPGDALMISFTSTESSPWPGEGEQAVRVLQVERIAKSSSLAVTVKRASA